ncbi:hypothetical protein DR64_1220 [Paraburkholderia xenovorans LB400]|uniref:Uncharacterized protein n=1 Tax=Paraburkholderia xenovorans (strain LB400) TaxID=266265 RepID=Q143M4_PARXL|nr:hypothetical protein Bxe_A3522 [Paraburkholderia xenovorans LB400]AIP33279.1 hypothetical protein DR64_1220 [Paraburkholderia xenovorans LB400]
MRGGVARTHLFDQLLQQIEQLQVGQHDEVHRLRWRPSRSADDFNTRAIGQDLVGLHRRHGAIDKLPSISATIFLEFAHIARKPIAMARSYASHTMSIAMSTFSPTRQVAAPNSTMLSLALCGPA